MPEVTVTMNDTLQETVEQLVLDAKAQLLEVFADNADFEHAQHVIDTWRHNGADHELVDSSVPIYNKEIDDLWYLHSDAFLDAYRSAGIGNGDEDNFKQVAIFCYLEEMMWESLHDWMEEVVEEVNTNREAMEDSAAELEMEIEELEEEIGELDGRVEDALGDEDADPDHTDELRWELQGKKEELEELQERLQIETDDDHILDRVKHFIENDVRKKHL